MNFYTTQHKYYCGIDLHTKKMYVCILNQNGEKVVHRNINTNPEELMRLIAPYREDIVICVECIFTWYWIADLCEEHNIPFVLAHALYMKAIHGGKTKDDRIDSYKIAALLRGGLIPQAYVYPQKMRSTRDLLRRRMHFMYKRSELIAHIQNTKNQYNLPDFEKKIAYKRNAARKNRIGIEECFQDKSVRKSVQADLFLLDSYDKLLQDLELFIASAHRQKHAKIYDPQNFFLLKTTPGIGKILGLVILYEINDIARFPKVQNFISYARLIKPKKTSKGKKAGKTNGKIGNAHLKWAFSETACLMIRECEQAKVFTQKMTQKHGKAKALSILSHKVGRAVYFMLKNKQAFDVNKLFNQN